ncbi:ribonuclease T [Methylomonas sp. MED-D]|uniref:Ribonuclease T n=1 Tax=Methylomonas koyamae TaxID=702114 RepID=A0A177NZK5_9GAMM|nr:MULTISPECIES: ribonuclease T [Methylomonas]NJA07795.1 ribonuclease T [Methylococcaceae bacterium WWC4]MDT4330972.1 ribonuclease T [Methylomonas sp. MV1]OAI23341.1 ribonuclease T [Methylomonas koyamae]OHX34135.1 ribonuclease T [Methylomonas sp. LWB]WGS84877.1 ribonuclease T [Methylomonas sp. UP202]
MEITTNPLGNRFRGYLPVIVDIETAGFNPKKNPLLEIAAIIVEPDEQGLLRITEKHQSNIIPFKHSELDEAALKFTGIDPYHPFRMAVDEKEALTKLFTPIKAAVKRNECKRAILVGHNPSFDVNFLNAAIERTNFKRSPFHPFSSFDTATLGALVYGQTVLAKIAQAAGLSWDNEKAHSALYDAEQTAELFCLIINRWKRLSELEVI